MSNRLVEIELQSVNWNDLRVVMGTAGSVPDSFRRLLKASTEKEAETAYWKLDNYVVVQGSRFDSGVALVPVILAALTEPRSEAVSHCLLELLSQIVNGRDDWDPIEMQNGAVQERCVNALRAGRWLLYRECLGASWFYAAELLKLIDEKDVRLAGILKSESKDFERASTFKMPGES